MNVKPPTSRRRQLFVLTPQERTTIAFTLCALVLGLATKHYRDKHPPPPKQEMAKEHHSAKKNANLHGASPSQSPVDDD